METIVVGIADGKVVKCPNSLVSYALGSCVGVCLYDAEEKIAGLVHILLPYQELAVNQKNDFKFADRGIRALIEEMIKNGAFSNRLSAKIVGGAEMFQHISGTIDIGRKNVEAVKKTLSEEAIPICGEDIGADYGRTVYFSAETGLMTVKTVGRESKVL